MKVDSKVVVFFRLKGHRRSIKFVGEGEKIEDMDIFHPDRMADRILGMGDVVTLVEKAQEKLDLEEANKMAERMLAGQFTMDDMLKQFGTDSKRVVLLKNEDGYGARATAW